MAREDTLTMTQRERKRLHVLHKVLEETLTQIEASDILELSTRHIRRMMKRLTKEGDKSIIHKSCGRPSHNAIDPKVKKKVIQLYQTQYPDFGPTLATEKLLERHRIQLSDETLRHWLLTSGDWKKSRQRRSYRQWRERKPYFGQLIQMDGSHHDWFEGRAPVCVLMAYIDDATGTSFARFYPYEGTFPAMESFKRYIQTYGLPLSLYLDKHTTYKSNAKPSLEDELHGREPLSEFERAARELNVHLIHAHSPQAKGRIERLFKTFQDRLIKEMRLKGIQTIEEANAFLEKYLPLYNRRFALPPKEKENLHRKPKRINLDRILCLKTERALRNDFTVAHHQKLYQIEDHLKVKKVVVEERLDGTVVLTHQGTPLKAKEISSRPKRETKKVLPFKPRKRYTPPEDHPWRSFQFGPPADRNAQKLEEELLLAQT